jgi:hypothetical protein
VITRTFQTGPIGVEDIILKVVTTSMPSSEDRLNACNKNSEVAETIIAMPHARSIRKNLFRGYRNLVFLLGAVLSILPDFDTILFRITLRSII